jgi:hypothetical protein
MATYSSSQGRVLFNKNSSNNDAKHSILMVSEDDVAAK